MPSGRSKKTPFIKILTADKIWGLNATNLQYTEVRNKVHNTTDLPTVL